ncbi:MAG: hypothetical protein ACMXYK_05450 [Candidatus Woesearchaeota archaeon]
MSLHFEDEEDSYEDDENWGLNYGDFNPKWKNGVFEKDEEERIKKQKETHPFYRPSKGPGLDPEYFIKRIVEFAKPVEYKRVFDTIQKNVQNPSHIDAEILNFARDVQTTIESIIRNSKTAFGDMNFFHEYTDLRLFFCEYFTENYSYICDNPTPGMLLECATIYAAKQKELQQKLPTIDIK